MNRYFKLLANILAPIIVIGLLIVFVPKIIVFFFPFVIGLIIAAIANPLIRFLNQKTHIMRRQHASVFIILMLLCLIGYILYAIFAEIIRLGAALVKSLPDYYQGFTLSLRGFITSHQYLLTKLPVQAQNGINDFLQNMSSYLGDLITGISSPAFNFSVSAVKSLPLILVYLVVTIFASYSFAKDGDKYMQIVRDNIPEKLAEYLARLRQDIRKILQGWLYAQFKIMFVVFLTLLIGFLILRITYAFPLAFLTAFLDFLPMFGVGFIMWPWILFDILTGEFAQALWLTLIYAITQVVRQFMQPKIMGDTMGLPPFLTILFLYLGFKFYGLAGMIFSVPFGMLFMCFYRYGAFDKMLHSLKELFDDLCSFL